MFDQAAQPAKAHVYWQLKMLAVACSAKIYLTHNALYNNGSIAWQCDLEPFIFGVREMAQRVQRTPPKMRKTTETRQRKTT